MDASKRAEELRALLNHHSNLYYNEDAPPPFQTRNTTLSCGSLRCSSPPIPN